MTKFAKEYLTSSHSIILEKFRKKKESHGKIKIKDVLSDLLLIEGRGKVPWRMVFTMPCKDGSSTEIGISAHENLSRRGDTREIEIKKGS